MKRVERVERVEKVEKATKVEKVKEKVEKVERVEKVKEKVEKVERVEKQKSRERERERERQSRAKRVGTVPTACGAYRRDSARSALSASMSFCWSGFGFPNFQSSTPFASTTACSSMLLCTCDRQKKIQVQEWLKSDFLGLMRRWFKWETLSFHYWC